MDFQPKEFVNEVLLRCYKCNHEFSKYLQIEENISDLDCPKCKAKSIEINLGKKKRIEKVG